MDIFNTFLTVSAVVLPVLMVPRAVRLFQRVKIADGVLAVPPEQRDRLMRSHRSMLVVMRLFVWLIPVVIILLAALHSLSPDLPWAIFVVIVEWMLWIVLEYSFEKWLVGYVSEHEKAAPG